MKNDGFSFYMEGTNGKAVLLVHGLTGAPSEMRYVGKYLNRRGYSVYCPLLAGHAVTEEHLVPYSWQSWAESVKEARDALAEKYSDIYAAGICAGGALALYVEAMHPNSFKGIALYSMTFRYDGWNVPKLNSRFAFLLPVVMNFPYFRKKSFKETSPFGVKNERIRSKVVEAGALSGCLPGFPWPCLLEMYRLNDEVKKLLPKITVPILLIHAQDDDTSHIRNAEYIRDNIGSECQFEVLHESYHMIHVDGEREKVAKLTQEFFDKNA